MTIVRTMNRIALGTVAALLALTVTGPSAQAHPYTANHRIGAHLSRVRTCFSVDTVYTVVLRNQTRSDRYFRAYELMDGNKVVTERKEWTRVPAHSTRQLELYVASGERETVVVQHNDEVLMARSIRGICY
jgi:hypothetical protein